MHFRLAKPQKKHVSSLAVKVHSRAVHFRENSPIAKKAIRRFAKFIWLREIQPAARPSRVVIAASKRFFPLKEKF